VKKVFLAPQARRELRAAMHRYERERIGAGRDLLLAVETALERIREGPHTFPRWHDEKPYRRLLVPRFKFSIFYRERDADVVVLAVAHPSRRPGYWLGRDR